MNASHDLLRRPSALLLSLALVVPICRVQAQQAPTRSPGPVRNRCSGARTPCQKTDQTASTSNEQTPLVLSPFEVNSTKDQGYYTQNTLAGTRLNNNIADLGSSITVVTRQQLEDTNSVNINDIFRYEANTEGAHTYTPTVLVRTNFSDTLGGTGGTTRELLGARLIRETASAACRPPTWRSTISSACTASVRQLQHAGDRDRARPELHHLRSGQPGGHCEPGPDPGHPRQADGGGRISGEQLGRPARDFRPEHSAHQGPLAVYFGQVYDSEGFEQKPSFDYTRREYAAFTLYPFRNHKTKITGKH